MDEDKLISTLEDHEKRLKSVEEALNKLKNNQEEPKWSKNTLSFEEFTSKLKDLTKYEDRAAIIIYYLGKYRNENFSLEKLIEYNKKVGWKSYSNPTMLIKRLKEKRYIEEEKSKGNSEITYRMLESCKEFIEISLKEIKKSDSL